MSETVEILREGIPYFLAAIGGAIAITVAISPSTDDAKWAAGFGLAGTAIAGSAGIAQPSRQREMASVHDPRSGVTAQVGSGELSTQTLQMQLPDGSATVPGTNPVIPSDRSTMPDRNDNFQTNNPGTTSRNGNFEFLFSSSTTNRQKEEQDPDWMSPQQAAESRGDNGRHI